VAYTVLFSGFEYPTVCAICGQERMPKARLRPAARVDGLIREAPVVLSVCTDCASPDWIPGTHVDEKEFEEARRRRG
jgi:hypothetical protein